MLKISIGQTNPSVGDMSNNINDIKDAISNIMISSPETDIIVFPECAISGYPLQDIVYRDGFMKQVHNAILDLRQFTKQYPKVGIIVGTPFKSNDKVYNSALFMCNGEILKRIDKHCLPNYGVFDEKRTFEQGVLTTKSNVIKFNDTRVGIMICQDMWGEKTPYEADDKLTRHVPIMASNSDVMIVINGSPYETKKAKIRKNISRELTTQYGIPLLYVNLVGGQDELVFDGNSFYDDGSTFYEAPSMETFYGSVSDMVVIDDVNRNYNEEDYNATILGLRDYIGKSGFSDVLLGLSGGVDSAIVAIMAADALGPDHVKCYRLPSKFSSQHSLDDAEKLCSISNMFMDTIDIEPIVAEFRKSMNAVFDNMGLPHCAGITDENIQARVRGNILMGISNNSGAMLLSTANMSESSLGYSTLGGDLSGGYDPIKDLLKTKIYELCEYRNNNIPKLSMNKILNVIPSNILYKEPSAELSENQKDSDSLPKYEILDQIISLYKERDKSISDIAVIMDLPIEEVEWVCNKIIKMEYKRRLSPPGIKLSSRIYGLDWRYPIANKFKN